MAISITDLLCLRHELPVIDVRSEGEYSTGHILGAINIPLLNNEERIAVGTDYKQRGQLEAIKTGFRLVGPRLLDIIHAADQVAVKRELIVHCWRGGMRSVNFCQFVNMAGIKTHQLSGGYKSYRQLAFESFKRPFQFKIIGGCTGSGKSEVLRALRNKGEQVIDLEHLARHKGSVFGGLMMPPQPTTEQFQNNLFEEILILDENKPIWIEDESIAVGKIFLPTDFWRAMCKSPIIEISLTKEERIQRLVDEYGSADRAQFLSAMEKITKKLGGQHFKEAKEKLLAGNIYSTIEILLNYYDKAYHNGLEKKKARVVRTVDWDGTSINKLTDQLMEKNIGVRI